MKKWFFGVMWLVAASALKAQTTEDVVNKHVEAIGGKANIDKIESIVMQGSLNVQGAEVSLKITRVKDKLFRQDISVAGINGYDLTTDKEGWTFIPFVGQTAPAQKNEEELKAAQEELTTSDVVYNAQQKGRKMVLQGKEDVAGVMCYKLQISIDDAENVTCFLDPTTYYIVRVIQTKKIMGQSLTVPVDFFDYKDVEGVKMAYTINTPQGAMTFSTIKANQTIDPKAYLHE